MKSIDGIISRIIFHKPSKFSPTGTKFLIARLHNGTTVKGEMAKPIEGESYRFYGEFKDQKGYDDQAFEFHSFEALIDRSAVGIAAYLATYVDGLGPVKSAALVETFGDDTLDILRTDAARAVEAPGITPTLVDNIARHFDEECSVDPKAYARLSDLFKDLRIPKKVIKALLKDWRSDAPNKVIERPYLLLGYPRMGWKTVDTFAMTVARHDPMGLDRHKAAILEGFAQLADQGHTHGTLFDIEAIVFPLIGSRPSRMAWTHLIGEGEIIVYKPRRVGVDLPTFATAKLAAAEAAIARQLALLSRKALPWPCRVDLGGLMDEQADAARLIAEHGVSVLTGPPGCGKSFTLAKILAGLVAFGIPPQHIRVMAPTGKAAKRAAELLAHRLPAGLIECSTIHRALDPVPGAGGEGPSKDRAKVGRGRDAFYFDRDADNPIDALYVVVDESSMVDVSLGSSLLDAIAPGCRVIFVGDHNQLPSVGPGSMLRDLMEAGVPTALLTKIVRSDGGGRVVRACHAIKDGLVPDPAPSVGWPIGPENWVHIEESDPARIASIIVDLHDSRRFDPLWDMQVVSAQKKSHAFACEPLNAMLSAKLNKRSGQATQAGGRQGGGIDGTGEEEQGFGPPFLPGDKVVRTKNGFCDELIETTGGVDDEPIDWTWYRGPDGERTHYKVREAYVVNGDMGQVLDVVEGDRDVSVVVRFRTPDRLCRLSYSECHLIRAYAMTVHRVQGSGFPYVIVPVHEAFYWDRKTETGLFNRELFYTAISRAERLLVTVGTYSAIRLAVGRKTVHRRRTKLVDLIRKQIVDRNPELEVFPELEVSLNA